MCPDFFYEQITMVAYGRIDGFYIAFNYCFEKVPIFFQYINSSSFSPLRDLCAGVISRSVMLGAPAGRNQNHT